MNSIRHVQGHFKNARDQELFYYSQFPPQDVALRGIVLFMHGLGEHALRFKHVFDHLNAHDFGAIAYDMVARGRSDCDCENVRGHSDRFAHFVQDTNAFVTFAKREIIPAMTASDNASAPALPLIFMGISFGTLVGVHTLLSGEHKFAAAVLASPAISVQWTPLLVVQSWLSKPLAWAIPYAKIVPAVNIEGLTRDPAFLKDYLADPLNVTDNLTARMGQETLMAMAALEADKRVETPSSAFCAMPFLIIQGSEDKVTSLDMAKSFFNRLANKDKEFKEFHGLFHCIFNEPEKRDVLAHVAQWLQQRFQVIAPAANAHSRL
ncbi:TPA: hypothetical protein N0F65_003149 [Lagenidium giganteum]|uniref:Serine aminopeptidase S33 domain-containing protein n=1 Tax=Lagenidium giganteum TaxID=4803 RepID=A0AAV2YER6_9STRA|nr:TPA: hypothetical protein N0F65_003149 [Lagenidium giganteum]